MKWKIYVKDRENLRILLNLLSVNRETDLAVRKTEGLLLYVADDGNVGEILKYAREELGNKIEEDEFDSDWRENVFLLNKPKYVLDPPLPFLIETSFLLIKGDTIHMKIERYSTFNPFIRKRLGPKSKRVLYRVKLFVPILTRDYSSRDGRQCLTLRRGNPLVLTSYELSSLINGGGNNGLLAL